SFQKGLLGLLARTTLDVDSTTQMLRHRGQLFIATTLLQLVMELAAITTTMTKKQATVNRIVCSTKAGVLTNFPPRLMISKLVKQAVRLILQAKVQNGIASTLLI